MVRLTLELWKCRILTELPMDRHFHDAGDSGLMGTDSYHWKLLLFNSDNKFDLCVYSTVQGEITNRYLE